MRFAFSSLRESLVGIEKLAQVDAYQQKTQWSCSAGALVAVAKHHGVDISEEEAVKAVGARKGRGAETTDIVNGARKLGFDAWEGSFPTLEAVKKVLKQGNPIIADVQSFNYPGKGHYVVIAGHKAGKGFIIMDPNTKGKTAIPNWRVLSDKEMEERWWDRRMAAPHEVMPKWGIVVIPKEKEKEAEKKQWCLRESVKLLRKDPSLTLMHGPASPDRPFDTRHFWVRNKKGKDIDPTLKSYPHYDKGKPLDMSKNPGVEKLASGDMLDYFMKHPQKRREYEARRAAKKTKVALFQPPPPAQPIPVAPEKKSHKGRKAIMGALGGGGMGFGIGGLMDPRGGMVSKKSLIGAAVGAGLGALGMSKTANDPVKEKLTLHGIPIALEWRKGETRKYYNHDPLKKRSVGTVDYNKKMQADYGYVRGVIDADGEELDVYLGPNRDSEKVFVLEKLRKTDGSFDENKIMLGYNSMAEAKKSYLKHQGKEEMGKVRELTIPEFEKEFMTKKKTALSNWETFKWLWRSGRAKHKARLLKVVAKETVKAHPKKAIMGATAATGLGTYAASGKDKKSSLSKLAWRYHCEHKRDPKTGKVVMIKTYAYPETMRERQQELDRLRKHKKQQKLFSGIRKSEARKSQLMKKIQQSSTIRVSVPKVTSASKNYKSATGDILGMAAMRRAKAESARHNFLAKMAHIEKQASLEAAVMGGKIGGTIGAVHGAMKDDQSIGMEKMRQIGRGLGWGAAIGALIALGIARRGAGKTTLPRFWEKSPPKKSILGRLGGR